MASISPVTNHRRFLHFVFKVGNRKETIAFYRSVLGMKVLRHEEFEEGCKASCNGPYDGKWSKTMIGYGPEDKHFVAELTYNYGVKSYKHGSDFLGLVIKNSAALKNARDQGFAVIKENGLSMLISPCGYKFLLKDKPQPTELDPVQKVILSCSSMGKSLEFWCGVLDMKVYEQDQRRAVLGYADNQCKLELQNICGPVFHEEAYGRIAFACPTDELSSIEGKVRNAGYAVLTPLVSLDTPGKATVHVVIIADPDGHEICFVGDEGFRDLSQVDPKGDALLNDAMEADHSEEWFAKNFPSKSTEKKK